MPEGAFNTEFLPAVRPGDYVELAPEGEVRQVLAYNTLVDLTLEDGGFTVPANDDDKQELHALKVEDGYLAQYRLPLLGEELPDGVEVEVDHTGKQQPVWGTKNARGRLTNETAAAMGYDSAAAAAEFDGYHTAFTEFYVKEQNAPNFNVINTTAGQITFDPTFRGYKFEVSAPTEPPENVQPVSIPVQAIN